MTYADQLLDGIVTAIELDIWELAEAMAKVLARHIDETGEYPAALPGPELERLVGMHRQAAAYGPS